MVSAFPSLLTYSEASPLLIRLTLGAVMVYIAYRTLKIPPVPITRKIISLIEGICGILLVIGLFTQVAAIIIFIDMAIRLYERISKRAFLTDGVNYYLILLVLALSLMFSGAGFVAFDMRL